IVKDIKEQLKERDGLDVRPYWAENDWPIASKLFEIIRDTMEWKPCLFIPEDPCRIVFWAYLDCLDAVEAQKLIEDEFNMTFFDDEVTQTEQFTMQELVNMIKKKLNTPNGPADPPGCGSAHPGAGLRRKEPPP
ncbi:MAG: hypothetical protein V2A78_07725, partial [bacterium]